MSEEKDHRNPELLIARHLDGTATPREEEELASWLSAGAQNRRMYDDMQRLWQESEKIRGLVHPDLDREWAALRSRLKSSHSSPAILRTLHRKKRTTTLLRIAAVLVIGLFAAALVQMITGPLTHRIYDATAQTETFRLSDGSVISLDRGSHLVTPRRFGRKTREVTLAGTAYFEVSHDAARPFTVHAGGVDITVLGTRFSVRNDAGGQQTVVDLVAGRVEVTARSGDKVLLAPGEEASWNKQKKNLTKQTITDPNFLAWKTKNLSFAATPLKDVLTTLERTYHVPFLAGDKEILNCRITASFDHEPLTAVLNTLSTILDISFEKDKKGYTVTGPGCTE